MLLSPVSSPNYQASKFSSFGPPLVVRRFGEEILEIFLDKANFLFGVISNPEGGNLKKRFSFLPLQPVLPEQVETLRELLSPKTSFLRLKSADVIQIEPKLLGGGLRTDVDPEVRNANKLFLELSNLKGEAIAGINQREIFDKITNASKALLGFSNYEEHLTDAWHVAKVLHMAIDILLLTIWNKGTYEKQNTRYLSEQKKAILKPITNAKKILEAYTSFPMKEETLLSLNLAETGTQLLPESDMKPKDWEAFIRVGKAVEASSISTHSNEAPNSKEVSKSLKELWLSLGGNWAVSPNLYANSIVARFLSLNGNLQEAYLIQFLKCLPVDETSSNGESEKISDPILGRLMALDRLTDLSLYDPQEDVRERAFHAIRQQAESSNANLGKTVTLFLTRISLLCRDILIKEQTSKILDEVSPVQEKDQFLLSYEKWVIDNLPEGCLGEETSKIEHVLEMARDKRFLDIIKRLSFCAAEKSIPLFLFGDDLTSSRSILQEIVGLGLIQENSCTYRISTKVQNKLKKVIPRDAESDEKTLFGLAKSLNKAWNSYMSSSNTHPDQKMDVPLHIQSLVENILEDGQTSDSMLVASIVFLNKLGLYHLFIKKDLGEAIDKFRKALSRFDFFSSEPEEETFSGFVFPTKQDVEFFFEICLGLKQGKSKLNLLDQKLGLNEVRFLSALIKIFPNISSLEVKDLGREQIDALASGIEHSKVVDLYLKSTRFEGEEVKAIVRLLSSSKLKSLNLKGSEITEEGLKILATSLPYFNRLTSLNLKLNIGLQGVKAIAAILPSSDLTSLDLKHNQIGDEGAKILANTLTTSQLTNLNLQLNKIGHEGAKALASVLPSSNLTSLNLKQNWIAEGGFEALARVLPKSQLIHLDLAENGAGTKAVTAIALALPKSQLTHLDLADNEAGLEGAKALAAALPSSNLASLNLRCNQIGDEGAKAIAIKLPDSKLTNLDLSFNRIGNEGAKALGEAFPKSQLASLSLIE